MPWLIVLTEAKAAEWVLSEQRMAFRRSARRVELLEAGDPIAFYTTTRVFHATTAEPQIVAVGRITGDVRYSSLYFAGAEYDRWCQLEIDRSFPVGKGLPFKPLIKRLGFIKDKENWKFYLFGTLIAVPPEDFRKIESAFYRFAAKSGASA
jgi:hypothetical protein